MKKKNVLKKLVVKITIAILVSLPVVNLAHSGRTDSSGGHKDNKNKSGLGSYHYHCGGNPPHLHTGGVCPYSGAATTSSTSSSSASSTSSSTKSTTPAKVNATSVSIEENDFEILLGESKVLSATVLPSNTTDKTITWKSDNEDVVMIDSEGEIVAMGVGEATITVSTINGKQSSIKVTVKPIKVTEIKLDKTEVNLKVEEEITITAEVLPENATDKSVEWTSENPNIVTVEEGRITANSSGSTKVICKSKDGVESVISITVEKEEVIEENTIETVADIDSDSSSGESSDSDAALGALVLAGMIGGPIYALKKKKNK